MFDLVKSLWDAIANGKRNIELRDQLWQAVWDGAADKIPTLAAQGAPIDNPYQSNDPDTPIVYAAAQGNIAVVEGLLAVGATINSRGARHVTPLMAASHGGHPHLVAYLLRHGADPYRKDLDGLSIYDHARLQDDSRKRARVLAILNEHAPEPPAKE